MSQAKRKLLAAAGLFWGVVALTLVFNLHNFQGSARPWFIGNSISWYVGSRVWSALLFAVANVFVAILMSQCLWTLGEYWRMPRAYFFFIILLVVALVWLSVFPLGFFDLEGQKSTISFLHEAGSRTMFGAMAIVIIFLATKVRTAKLLHAALVLFPLYALFCAVSALGHIAGFYSGILIYESSYILGFFLLLLLVVTRVQAIDRPD